jgi:UDP-sulfoquinovose synthase
LRVFIAGIDGYLGWALSQYLTRRGHEESGCDSFYRRRWVGEVGSQSATPIRPMEERLAAFKENFGKELPFWWGDLQNYHLVLYLLDHFKPDAIVHLAEMPSAPFSMIDVNHAVLTQTNNIIGTLNLLYGMKNACPKAHLVKLGTMGEYGTPNIDIPEGVFTIEYRGRTDTLPSPRQAGSWYHQTKVHDTNNIMFACKIWGLRSTDIMQGVVFGTRIDEMGNDERLLTRFDFDECFGTAINRYCAEAVIGHPLSPFGKGNQTRGFLPLRDSMQCLTLAITNPPREGEYRTFNQFEEIFSVNELAKKFKKVGDEFGLNVEINNLENPRIEKEEHYYNPDHKHLLDLGYKPSHDVEQEMRIMIQDLIKYKDRIEEKREYLIPQIRWDGTKRKSRSLIDVKA